jgi:hypothetical protein
MIKTIIKIFSVTACALSLAACSGSQDHSTSGSSGQGGPAGSSRNAVISDNEIGHVLSLTGLSKETLAKEIVRMSIKSNIDVGSYAQSLDQQITILCDESCAIQRK